MKILLSYFIRDFDPGGKKADEGPPAHSSSILARVLHAWLSQKGVVTRVDSHDVEAVRGKSFDLYVGVLHNFDRFCAAIDCPRKILFARNVHPRDRQRRLRNFVGRYGLSRRSFCDRDRVDLKGALRSVRAADGILCVGNNEVLNSYLARGVPWEKLRLVNDSAGPALPRRSAAGRPMFLYCAAEIGLRKGFDIVEELARRRAGDERFTLEIVGRAATPVYEEKLAALRQTLQQRCVIHGWLDSSTTAYAEVLQRAAFVLLPTLEEGQAGTVLEALRQGAIPLVTSAAGIDFAPLGFLEPALGSRRNAEIVQRALALSEPERLALSRRSSDYYATYHAQASEQIGRGLAALWAHQPLPKVSIILPIFNKEKTILGLVGLLHRVCTAYGNCELIVIFDGCHDRSEALVRGFFQRQRPSYPVVFEVTPDIFEVKSNNLGLRRATGDYGVVLQDDIYLYDRWCLHEAVLYLEKNRRCAILGGLAGVNFYPRDVKKLDGPGEMFVSRDEVYWRQDQRTDPELPRRIFQTDTCMRGPLIFRKSFLETHGYLDEAYSPFYNDDMDICMRAADRGFTVQTMLMDVENKGLTQAHYSPERARHFQEVKKRNCEIFYGRWNVSCDKSAYEWINRVPLRRRVSILARVNRFFFKTLFGFSLFQWMMRNTA